MAAAVAPVYVLHNLEGVIRLGSYSNDEFVGEVKRLTGADVCLARNGVAFASTYCGTTPGESVDLDAQSRRRDDDQRAVR